LLTLAPQTDIQGYTLLRELGSGTSGTVWRAERAGKAYAIKFFKPGFGALAIEEFDRMQRVEHPNIIDEYELGQYAGTTFLVMDYLEGQPLDALAATDFSPEEMLRLARDLASGLAHAHEQELIHRDLKPANIFLTPDKQLKILDFGASAPVSYDPNAKLVAGSYSYMSPEQLAGRANFQNDIWSYGVTLYRLFTGEHPYHATRIEELSEKMLLVDVDFPHHLNPAIPASLSYVLIKCLRKSVPDRYRNFTEVLADLAQDPVREITRKFGGKRRMLRRLKFAEKSLRVSEKVGRTTTVFGWILLPATIATGINFDGLGRLINAGIVRVFRLKNRRKVSIEEDLMKVGLVCDQEKFTALIERIDTYRHYNRRGTATREYLLHWHWKHGRYDAAREIAAELAHLDENNTAALSFQTNWAFRNHDIPVAIAACRRLMQLNPGDASSFFFEKVLLRDQPAAPGASPADLLAETVQSSGEGSPAAEELSALQREVLQSGYARLPLQISHYNFHHLVEKASPEQTSTGRRILSRFVTIEADLILHPDFCEISPRDAETEKISHIVNTHFQLPETFPYADIQRAALYGSCIGLADGGWLTFRFGRREDQQQWHDFLLTDRIALTRYAAAAATEWIATADQEKTAEKNTARWHLTWIGLLVLLLVLNAGFGWLPGELVFLGLFLFYIVAGEIWRTLLAFYIFAWKKLKLRRWLRQIRYNSAHFRAFFSVLLEHSWLPSTAPPAFPDRVVAQPFSFDLQQETLSYRKETIPFAAITAIRVGDQRLEVEAEGFRTLSLRHRGTDFAAYLPVFCRYLGDRMELR
jgi:serine/threonine-protein kinase